MCPYNIQIRLQESNDTETVSIAVNCFKRRRQTWKQQYENSYE